MSIPNEAVLLDISELEVGERVEINGRTGVVAVADTALPDQSAGAPVKIIDWDDHPKRGKQ